MELPITGVKEVSLYVADLERSRAFYHGFLAFPVISEKAGRHIFFRAGSTMLLCFLAEATRNDDTLPPHFGSGQLHLAFEVPAEVYSQVKQQCQDAGLSIEHTQQWAPGVESFYFRDPDAHSLEIIPSGMWGF
jgi:catechol 2,3-dioxygenase-like lactoylglutathione lyase family enzyme